MQTSASAFHEKTANELEQLVREMRRDLVNQLQFKRQARLHPQEWWIVNRADDAN